MLEKVSFSNVATLTDGKLYALQNSLHLDGRVSAYPARARGYSMANCYLLVEDDAATLLDTGYAVHEPVIRRQIASLLGPEQRLSLFPLRLNEFMSINNVETLAAHFDV